jgi:uncharacterized protein YjiS (DUF1127 family)
MRFEEFTDNVVLRYPEFRVHRPQQETPPATRKQVSDGVALGRRLHGKFWRQAATAVFWNPVKAAVQTIARERARRSTIRALRDLEDHRLQDIGIERGDIHSFAWALAYGPPQTKKTTAAKPVPATTSETFEIAKAA